MRSTRASVLWLLATATLSGCGGNPIYSQACANLSRSLDAQIDEAAATHASCQADADCVLAVVLVPCNRDAARTVAINPSDRDRYGAEMAAVAATCTQARVDDCNAHCGAGGSLLVPAPSPRCEAGRCALAAAGLAAPGTGLSVPAAELCRPSRAVWLSGELRGGAP